MSIEIRRATVDDSNVIACIHDATWRFAYADLAPDFVKEKLSLSHRFAQWKQSLSNPPSGSQLLLAFVDKKALGFVCFEITDFGKIQSLYVDPGSQGQGLGRALLQASFTEIVAAGCASAELAVVVGNDKALGFYLSQGGRKRAEQVTEGDVWKSRNWIVCWDDLKAKAKL